MKLALLLALLLPAPGCGLLLYAIERKTEIPATAGSQCDSAIAACGPLAEACNRAAECFITGEGRKRDPAEAARYEQLACDDADAAACARLAERLVAGNGVPADVDRARALFERACALGSSIHCERLGWAYEHGAPGWRIPRSEGEALWAFRRACSHDPHGLKGCDDAARLAAARSRADAPRAPLSK